MSGNQEPRIRPPTWRCSDVPIKKRKYLVEPQLPAMEEAGSTLAEKIPQANDQGGDTSVGMSVLDSSHADANQKMIGGSSMTTIGEPISSLPSVSVGNAGKGKSIGNVIFDQSRVKLEKPNSPTHSTSLAGFQIPYSSNILSSSIQCALGTFPVVAGHPGVVVSSGETGMKVEKTLLKTHDIVTELGDKETLRGECQTDASSGANTVSLRPGCKTNNNSPYWKDEEPTTLNLSLSKGGFPAHNTDSISTSAKSGNSGVNRANWDLNTTMDAWEDALDRTTRVKTTGSFLNSNRSLHDIETSSCRDSTVIAKSVSEKRKEIVGFRSPMGTLMQFDHQVAPTCSLSLGLSSYPPFEKSPSLPATTSGATDAFTSISRPILIAGNVNSVNLRTVKSEIIEETVRQETESAHVCPIGLPIKGVKPEVVGRFSQGNSPSSGISKPVVPISIKAEPNAFAQSEVFNRIDGTLNHSHTPIMQSNEVPDLPTSSTPYQKDKYIPCSSGISNAPMPLNGMTIIPGVQSYPDCTLKENSGQSSSAANGKLCEVLKHGGVHTTCADHEDHNLDVSGVNVTSLTEEKILDDCKTGISKELPRNSRGTDELSTSDEEKIILSGKELEEQLYSNGVESDCGDDLSRVINKQVEKRNLYDDAKVQGPAAVFTEGNEVTQAQCGGSETDHRNINVPYDGNCQNSYRVEEKGRQPALLGNTVKMASTEVHIKRHTPELQSRIFDGSGENEGRIIQDGEGMSGVSTVSGGIENPEIVDNSSPVSYKAEMSTIDNDPLAECSDGSQSRIINLAQVSNKSPIKTLDATGSFVPLGMERDRLPDFPLEPRRYLMRGSDESCKFSRERYHGKIMRSPRLNFMPDRRRLPDNTESNRHDQDTKNFEFDNHGNTRRGGAFMSNFQRGRRPANDEGTPYSHSFPRRTPNFSFNRGPTNKEDASAFHGFRDGEKFTRGLQGNNTEPMFMNPLRQYQGRNGNFSRGRTKFSNNPRGSFSGFRSRSPVRSRERSDGSSSSFRNRSQEAFSGHTDFSHRKSPSGYRMDRINSPDHSGYSREMVVRRHNSPPYLHRPSNAGRGRGYPRGRGYARGRGYGRDGNSFRKPSDRVVHRNHGNLNNLDPRERVDYSDDFFEGPIHSERFGVDVNAERRRFGYRHDGTSSFRPSFHNDGYAPTNVENDHDAVRLGQDPDMKIEEQGNLMETDGKNKNSTENASGRTKNMEEEETSKHNKIWQQDELGGDGF